MGTMEDEAWRQRVEGTTEFLAIVDHAGRLLYVNRLQPGEAFTPGMDVFEIITPPYRQHLRHAAAQARATGLPQHYESEARGPSGETSFYSNWVVRLNAEAQDLIAIIATEITHQRRIEAALEVSEGTLRGLVANAPDYILIVGRDRRVEFVNRVHAELEVADVVGHPLDEHAAAGEEQKIIQAVDYVFETGKTTSFEVAVDLPDGRHEYSARLGPILHDGRVERLTLIATEITAQRAAEREAPSVSTATSSPTSNCSPSRFASRPWRRRLLGPSGCPRSVREHG